MTFKRWWGQADFVEKILATVMSGTVSLLIFVTIMASHGWIILVYAAMFGFYKFMNWYSKEDTNARDY